MIAGLQLAPCTSQAVSMFFLIMQPLWAECQTVHLFLFNSSRWIQTLKGTQPQSRQNVWTLEIQLPSLLHPKKGTCIWNPNMKQAACITDQWIWDLVTLRITIPSLSSPSEDLITTAFEMFEFMNPRLKGTTGRVTAFSFTFTASNQVIDDLLRKVHRMCIPHDSRNTKLFD